jgi:hypothetical protein
MQRFSGSAHVAVGFSSRATTRISAAAWLPFRGWDRPSAAHPLLRRPDGSTIDTLPAHPHEGAVSATADEESCVIAVGSSLTTGRDFNLLVAFSGRAGTTGPRLGRGIADSSFHHFADYNWDTRRGAPSFVTDPEGSAIVENPALLADTRTFVHNAARWLAPLA